MDVAALPDVVLADRDLLPGRADHARCRGEPSGECLGLELADRATWTVLWTGSDARAQAHASEELFAFWETWLRVTVTEYRRQLAGARRAQADERERVRVRYVCP